MNDNSSQSTLTFEPILNIRLTRMPSCPQPRDKLYKSAGMTFRLSQRFVYKPRLNAGSYVISIVLPSFQRTKQHRRAWKLYDGVTIPRKEDLILVGNPDKRSSRLVYTLADQAEYRMLDINEIPFATLATTRNITSAPMDFGKRNNDFQFTFEAVAAPTRSQIQVRTRSAISAPSPSRLQRQTEAHSASPVTACIAAVTSYFASTSPTGHTPQKRSRENAFEDHEDQDTEANCRHFGSTSQWYKRMRVLTTSIGCQ